MTDDRITTFGERPGGGRARQFSAGNVGVLITPMNEDHDDEARVLAENLFSATHGQVRHWLALERRARDASARAQTAEARTAELMALLRFSPTRMHGILTARFDRVGYLWLLNRREDGWASFGLCFASWDEVFRRFNCRVLDHGVDEAGCWWSVAPPQGLG